MTARRDGLAEDTTASTSAVEGIARDAAARVWCGARLPLESVVDETERVARAVLATRDPGAVWEAVFALLMMVREVSMLGKNPPAPPAPSEPDRGFGNYL